MTFLLILLFILFLVEMYIYIFLIPLEVKDYYWPWSMLPYSGFFLLYQMYKNQ